ncbi:unannotated protein [freshwater metagenome]|uniref:Unannotated protein n=1 Tax=freshwater metagenome TaxID=449393 RepID=A0A6J7VJ19_9ZZZZ
MALGSIEVTLTREEGEGIDGARCGCVERDDDGAAISDNGGRLLSGGRLSGGQSGELLVASARACVGAIHAGNGGGSGCCASRGSG